MSIRYGHGFHDGELAMQERSGVSSDAARLEAMLAPTQLSRGAIGFLGAQTFAALTARDDADRLWIAALHGPPGFLEASAMMLAIHVRPAAAGPLGSLRSRRAAALIAVDFQARRRFRVNGPMDVDDSGLRLLPREAYGNCPSYIQQRAITPIDAGPDGSDHIARRSSGLDPEQCLLVTQADTFFLGTSHPHRGADASHRGGEPGFVRVDGGELWWPDYPGNNMFNSMGNISVNPEAALLFVDFESGAALHLSGTASVKWTDIGTAGDDGLTGRRVHFRPEIVVETRENLRQLGTPVPSSHNPPVT